MLKHTLPDPRYECVRDHLEQALAIAPKDAMPLRAHIEVAVEAAIELAYRRQPENDTLQLFDIDRVPRG